MKKRIFTAILLCFSVSVFAEIVDFQSLPGFFRLQNQMSQLNQCMSRYIDSLVVRAASVGGDLSSAVIFETQAEGACRLVVDSGSYVESNGTLHIDTPNSAGSGLSPALTGQHFVFYAWLEGGVPYATNLGPVAIKTWTGHYAFDAGTVNLKSFVVLNTPVNFLAAFGSPMSILAG